MRAVSGARADREGAGTLVGVLERSCARFASRPAYRNLGVTLTFAELERASRALAAWFQHAGLARGERVALMMPNLLQYPVALFGALRAGLTVVNTNPLYTARELRHQLEDSGASAIVVLENFAHVLEAVIAQTRVRRVIVTAVADLAPLPKRVAVNFVVRRVKRLVPPYTLAGAVPLRAALAQGEALELAPPALTPEDLAFLQYTGGTTGVPKGAMLTHGNMVANLGQMREFWGAIIEPGGEVMVTPLPLYHVFCLTCNCLLFLDQGGLNLLITDPRDIPAMIAELARTPFSMMTGVNTLYAALLDDPRFRRLDFSRLKLGAAGGAALHPGVAADWLKTTGRPLLEGYGLTEASPVVACNPPEAPRLGTVGIRLPRTEISIRGEDGELPRGEAGELRVRGPQVMRGYWHRPEETAEVLSADGWLRTGDIALLEPSGYLRIVDRKKDLINVSGFKVFPNEIESVLGEHPSVLESGCIGVPDARSGEAVKVFIVPRPGTRLTVDEVLAHCRARLTSYKIPRQVEFRDTLPKSPIGKILRRELAREQAERAA